MILGFLTRSYDILQDLIIILQDLIMILQDLIMILQNLYKILQDLYMILQDLIYNDLTRSYHDQIKTCRRC